MFWTGMLHRFHHQLPRLILGQTELCSSANLCAGQFGGVSFLFFDCFRRASQLRSVASLQRELAPGSSFVDFCKTIVDYNKV